MRLPSLPDERGDRSPPPFRGFPSGLGEDNINLEGKLGFSGGEVLLMANRFISATAAVLLSLCGFPQATSAQLYFYRHRPPQQSQSGPMPVTLDGTVLSISSSEMQVMVSAGGKGNRNRGPRGKWTVVTQPKTTFTVTGEAKADYLKPGLTVRFHAENASKAETLEDKVRELTIVGLPHSGSQHAAAPAKTAKPPTAKALDLSNGAAATEVVGHLGPSREKQWMVRRTANRCTSIWPTTSRSRFRFMTAG